MFATLAGTIRYIQSRQQAFRVMRADIQAGQDDMSIVRNFTSIVSRESLAARREAVTLNGRLSIYVGCIDGIQLRIDET